MIGVYRPSEPIVRDHWGAGYSSTVGATAPRVEIYESERAALEARDPDARGFAPAVELRDEPWLSDFFAEPPLTVEFQGQTVPVLSRSRWGVIRHRDHAAGVAGRRAHLRTDAEWAAILG